MKYDDSMAKSITPPKSEVISVQTAFAENEAYPEIKVRNADELDFSVLQSNLGSCLDIINDEVMKGYLTNLTSADIVQLDDDVIENMKDIQLFKITELVYDKNEFSTDKLSTVFHSLSSKPCILTLMIKSDGVTNNFYLGARPLTDNSPGTMRKMLESTFKGQFPGSKIELYPKEALKEDMDDLNADSITAVTGIADYKREKNSMKNQEFIQGLEKFVYSMNGKKFTAVFLADSLSYEELMIRKREYEEIYTQLSPFANMQLNFTVSKGETTTEGISEGMTYSTSSGTNSGVSTNYNRSSSQTVGTSSTHGVTDTKGNSESVSTGNIHTIGSSNTTGTATSDSHTSSTSSSTTVGAHVGFFGGFGGGVSASQSSSSSSSNTSTTSKSKSHTDSVSDAVSKTLSHGTNRSRAVSDTNGKNESSMQTVGYGGGTQYGTSYSVSDSFNLVNSKSLSNNFGSTQGITLNAKNMTIDSILERIKKHLDRFDECESIGMWNFAAYFLGDTVADTETAANTYRALMSGSRSGIERSALNTWAKINDWEETGHISTGERQIPKINSDVDMLQKYIKNFIHPVFVYNRHTYDGYEAVGVSPAALVSTNELAIHLSLPRHSVKGLPVIEHAVFGQEVLTRNSSGDGAIDLGNIYHLGEEFQDTTVDLDKNSLTMHTFITGSTGSGKSNTVFHMLKELNKNQVPFLVIEPAKGEYKDFFPNVQYFGTSLSDGNILHINPFAFSKKVDILEHVEKLAEIFNVCWPMYAAMPAVLKDSIISAYISAGWDMDTSVNTKLEGLFPTFDDILRELDRIIKTSEYSSDTKSDYIGSLSTRIKSLTNGINGRIFSGNEIDGVKLFDENTIVDISKVGSTETKALIMGFMILKLQEYRQANTKEMNAELCHVTVLEEAHNLLRKTSMEQNQESSNVQGKSVEMLTNAIAEIRTYGEGFIIADQAPNLLDTAVIRNTNTKIVMRLPDGNDREIIGCSMALSDEQISELSKLPKGVAAVYQNDWQDAVLCKIPYEPKNIVQKSEPVRENSSKIKNADVLHMLIKKSHTDEELSKLKEDIMMLNVSAKMRRELICNINDKNLAYEWAVADFIRKCFKYDDIFKGTGDGMWQNYEQLADIMTNNVRQEFDDFSNEEIRKILYYICRTQHELHPENKIIERLRVEYLKKEVM